MIIRYMIFFLRIKILKKGKRIILKVKVSIKIRAIFKQYIESLEMYVSEKMIQCNI